MVIILYHPSGVHNGRIAMKDESYETERAVIMEHSTH